MREIKFRVWDKEENKFYPIFNLEEYIVWKCLFAIPNAGLNGLIINAYHGVSHQV